MFVKRGYFFYEFINNLLLFENVVGNMIFMVHLFLQVIFLIIGLFAFKI